MYKHHLTNPERHDPDNFIYLVHGVMVTYDGLDIPSFTAPKLDPTTLTYPSKIELDNERINLKFDLGEIINKVNPPAISKMEHSLKKIQDPNDFYSASVIGRLTQDNARRRFGMWGGGDISQLATFGNFGFILQPEDEDIYVAWNNDLGTPEDKHSRKVFANRHRGKRKNIFELLTTISGPAQYTELLIKGNSSTPIVGIFYLDVNKQSQSRGETLARIAMDLLKKQLPVVPIPFIRAEKNDIKSSGDERNPELEHLLWELEMYRSDIKLRDYGK